MKDKEKGKLSLKKITVSNYRGIEMVNARAGMGNTELHEICTVSLKYCESDLLSCSTQLLPCM